MGAKIGVLLNCCQQSQFSKVRREFDTGRVNLDPPMTCADWPVPGNLTVLHTGDANRIHAQTVTPELFVTKTKHISVFHYMTKHFRSNDFGVF